MIETCLMCGIRKDVSIKETCAEEAELWGVRLVNIKEVHNPHIWVVREKPNSNLRFEV